MGPKNAIMIEFRRYFRIKYYHPSFKTVSVKFYKKMIPTSGMLALLENIWWETSPAFVVLYDDFRYSQIPLHFIYRPYKLLVFLLGDFPTSSLILIKVGVRIFRNISHFIAPKLRAKGVPKRIVLKSKSHFRDFFKLRFAWVCGVLFK